MARLDRALSTVRAATTLASSRPAYAAGVRGAVATVVPLAIATLAGNPAAGTWLSLGGFNSSLSDRGGSYRNRAMVMGAVVAATCAGIVLGSMAGRDVRVALPLTFAVALMASLARVWGGPGVSVGSSALSTFVIALAYPSPTAADALGRAGFALLGGGWAMLLALLVWPLRPYRPARLAVGASYDALGDFIQEVTRAMGRASPASRPEVPVGSAVVRGALEEARLVLAQLRRGRPGGAPRGEQLVVLGDLVDQLFGHVIAVTESIEAIPPRDRDPAAQLVVLETLAMIGTTVRALADAVRAERDAPPIPLGWNGDTLRALLETHRSGTTSDRDVHYLHAAMILDRAASYADAAAGAADALSGRRRAATSPSSTTIPTTVSDDDAAPTPWAELRAILTPESVILRYALRVAVVVTMAVLLVQVMQVKRGYWLTITVIVILQPYTAATTNRALQRVLGTVLGGILTAALGAMFHAPLAVMALSFVFAGMCIALMPVNYAAYSVFLTPTFVLLAETSAGDWHLAATRVVNTVLGGALALAGARLLWPSPESTRLPRFLALAMRENAAYLRVVTSLFGDRGEGAGERMRAARRRIGLATANAEESFQRWMGEQGEAPDAMPAAMTLMIYTRRLTASVASLALARHTSPPEVAQTLVPFGEAGRAILDELGDALEQDRPPAPLPVLGALDLAEEPVPPLLRARVNRLAAQIRVLQEGVARWAAD